MMIIMKTTNLADYTESEQVFGLSLGLHSCHFTIIDEYREKLLAYIIFCTYRLINPVLIYKLFVVYTQEK